MTQRETVSETILQISRTFNAPRELVFQAWTQPESLSRWWAAGPGFTTPIAEVDLRVGGKYRLGMLAPDQDQPYVVGGVYKEMVHSEKLVYTGIGSLTDKETTLGPSRNENRLWAVGKPWSRCFFTTPAIKLRSC